MRIEQLTKKFGKVTAVDKVDLDASNPQMIGIIGPSGAGKSTFLRMINRLTPATSGTVLVDGRNILDLEGADKRAWQRGCAMIFQQFNLVPRLDVVTNVMLGRLNRHSTFKSMFNIFGKDEIERAFSALDRLGIAEQALKRAEQLVSVFHVKTDAVVTHMIDLFAVLIRQTELYVRMVCFASVLPWYF